MSIPKAVSVSPERKALAANLESALQGTGLALLESPRDGRESSLVVLGCHNGHRFTLPASSITETLKPHCPECQSAYGRGETSENTVVQTVNRANYHRFSAELTAPSGGGWVYFAVSPSLPGLIKVGKTKRPYDRLTGIGGSAPIEFGYAFLIHAEDYSGLESQAHVALSGYRHREHTTGASEFFAIELARAVSLVMARAQPFRVTRTVDPSMLLPEITARIDALVRQRLLRAQRRAAGQYKKRVTQDEIDEVPGKVELALADLGDLGWLESEGEQDDLVRYQDALDRNHDIAIRVQGLVALGFSTVESSSALDGLESRLQMILVALSVGMARDYAAGKGLTVEVCFDGFQNEDRLKKAALAVSEAERRVIELYRELPK